MMKIIFATLAAVAMSPVWALDLQLGKLTATDVPFQGTFTQRSGDKTIPDTWTDNFTFEMVSSGDLILSLSDVIFNSPRIDFTRSSQLTGPNGNEPDAFGLAFGIYTLTISGSTGGTGGTATYAGTMHANYVGNVPEPGTYAFMLLGLAGIGFVARRRMA